MDPPELPVAQLVRLSGLFGISENRARVALSRMVAGGEVTSDGSGRYRLAGHLAARQSRQSASRAGTTTPYDGEWWLAVVTTTGSSAEVRSARRRTLAYARLAELREGVWMRPANLAVRLPDPLDGDVELMTARPEDPVTLTNRLWDLTAWSAAPSISGATAGAGPDRPEVLAPGFELSAAVLRHLQADPLLPPALLPTDWPGRVCAPPTTNGTPVIGRRCAPGAASAERRDTQGGPHRRPGLLDRDLPIRSVQQVERIGRSVVVDEEDAAATRRDGQAEEVASRIEGVDGARVDLRAERCDLDSVPVVPVDGDQVTAGRNGQTEWRIEAPSLADGEAPAERREEAAGGKGDGRNPALDRVGDIQRAVGPSATPVGPRTRALELSSSANPVAIVVVPNSTGGRPAGSKTLRRSTVPWFTWLPAAATVPLSTLVTNSSANGPNSCTEVMSQGPLMPWPAHVSTGTPALLRTMRHPASGVPLPFSVTGRLPTTT